MEREPIINSLFHCHNTAQCWGGVIDGEFWFPETWDNSEQQALTAANWQTIIQYLRKDFIAMEKKNNNQRKEMWTIIQNSLQTILVWLLFSYKQIIVLRLILKTSPCLYVLDFCLLRVWYLLNLCLLLLNKYRNLF